MLALCPPALRQLAHETFVRPMIEHTAFIWSPHQLYLTKTLESVQNCAAHFILIMIVLTVYQP